MGLQILLKFFVLASFLWHCTGKSTGRFCLITAEARVEVHISNSALLIPMKAGGSSSFPLWLPLTPKSGKWPCHCGSVVEVLTVPEASPDITQWEAQGCLITVDGVGVGLSMWPFCTESMKEILLPPIGDKILSLLFCPLSHRPGSGFDSLHFTFTIYMTALWEWTPRLPTPALVGVEPQWFGHSRAVFNYKFSILARLPLFSFFGWREQDLLGHFFFLKFIGISRSLASLCPSLR